MATAANNGDSYVESSANLAPYIAALGGTAAGEAMAGETH